MQNKRPQTLQMTISSHDTAATLMVKIYDQFETRAEAIRILGDPSQNMLKFVGFDEYIHGTETLYCYETIRASLRNRASVDLCLIQRPIPRVLTESAARHPEIYKERVDPAVPILTIDDFTETRATSTMQWDAMTYFPLRSLQQEFRYRVRGIEGVSESVLPRLDSTHTHLRVRVFLFHGTEIIKHSDMTTTDAPRCQSPRWSRWLTPPDGVPHILASNIPREARISILLYGKRSYTKDEDLLSWVNVPLVDEFGHVRSGMMHLKMWTIDTNIKQGHLDALTFVFRGTTVENLTRGANHQPVSVCIEFEQRALSVTAPIVEVYREPDVAKIGEKQLWKKLSKEVRTNLDILIKTDPLYVLTPKDKEIFWTTRHHLLPYPLALPKFLQSVDWTSVDHRNEAHRLLSNWTPPLNPVSALELLDARYADYKVREYAVNCLRVLPDDELQLFLLQLAQSIKNEPYHDSPLTRFLVERALRNPHSIGHSLFWHLKAELHSPFHCERYAMILEEYLFHSGWHAAELRKQYEIVQRLQRISGKVVARKHAKDMTDDEIQAEYLAALHKFNENYLSTNESTQIPLNPKWLVTTLVVEKCRFMSSKMAPLWLVFKNADPLGDNIIIMFKSGDDLRQDILTLQLLKVMDKIWVSEDLDMRLIPYNCVSTGINAQGKGVGLIEIVLNSDTTSGIQLKYGGGALGALKLDPLHKFIADHNKEPDQYESAKDNFIKSCAGYCVATYVLGIGDRHNGNIMLTKDGRLFHIDFGHFLGNFKSKFGIKRERAAFVLTPEMAFVMGGKNYKKAKEFRVFTDLSAQAFTILRNHASLFINLFSLMVSAQMPELMFQEDIHYLRDKFFLQDSEKGAVERLRKEIQKSLNTTYRQFDNLIHNIKHK
ncbi:PI3-kinase family, ras-binding domain [Plasmodiophora brassicae]|nr:hypothetical protein PBRA_003977 [Plasmodiophora brassicae]